MRRVWRLLAKPLPRGNGATMPRRASALRRCWNCWWPHHPRLGPPWRRTRCPRHCSNRGSCLRCTPANGETLVSAGVQASVAANITLEPRPPVQLKGKSGLQPVFLIKGLRQTRAMRLPEPNYALPMVGRETELAQSVQVLEQVLAGHGHVLGLTAEAGVGKSRLVAELVRLAQQRGMVGYGGAAQSTGTRSPYLIWQPIWRALFDVDPGAPLRRQLRALEGMVDDWAPERAEATPLLGPLLGLTLPENDFTQSLTPKDRQSTLHALLRDCLVAIAREAQADSGSILIVLEDVHWLDAASATLFSDLVPTIAGLPVLLLLAYRPPDLIQPLVLPLAALPNFTEISLAGLPEAAAAQLIQLKLRQLFPTQTGVLAAALVTQLQERVQGNPFYLEELLNDMHDRALDPRTTDTLATLELPDSLHRLILSRMDRLSGQQQIILKALSVIGRRFLVAWLYGAFPTLVPPGGLPPELAHLAQLDLVPLDTPEPELAYLFKHIVTRDVAYESLGAATRALLHEQLASYLEQMAGAEVERLLDILAYHYEQSDNLAKKREYLRRAGEAAAARYANAAALGYLSRALALAPPDDVGERYRLLLAREQVLALGGDREPQRADLAALVMLADQLADPAAQAEVALRQARLANDTSDLVAAEQAARAAAALAQTAGHGPLEAKATHRLGWVLRGQRAYGAAQTVLARSLALAETADDQAQLCATLNALSALAADQGNYTLAREYLERSSALARATGNRRMECHALSDLAGIAGEQGQVVVAVSYIEQCLTAARTLGDRRFEGQTLGNLSFMRYNLGDYAAARTWGEQSLALANETGDRQQLAFTCGNLGLIALAQGDTTGASTYYQQSLALGAALGDRFLSGLVQRGLGNVALALGDLTAAAQAFAASTAMLREVGTPALVAEPLAGLARVALAQQDAPGALVHVEAVLAHLESGTLDGAEEPMLVYLTCYQALQANADPRAPALLARARTELQARAAQIADPAAQKRFLEEVAAHRGLLAADG